MKLRSGTTVGIEAVADIAADTYDAATAAAALTLSSFTVVDTPILEFKQMADIISPLLKTMETIEGEHRMIRKIPFIIRTFRAVNRCDMDHMVQFGKEGQVKITRFVLVALNKSCEMIYTVVDHLVRGHGASTQYTNQDKHMFITALTELTRAKRKLENLIRGWIGSADAFVCTALLNSWTNEHEDLHNIYRSVVNRKFFGGTPPFSMDDANNEGWDEADLFDNCFINPLMSGFVWTNCTLEYQVNILGKSGKDVFGKKKFEYIEETLDDIDRLVTGNQNLWQNIDENNRKITDAKRWLNFDMSE